MKRFMMFILAAAMCIAMTACALNTADRDNKEGGTEEEYHIQVKDTENGDVFGSFVSSDLEGNEVTDAVFEEKLRSARTVDHRGVLAAVARDQAVDKGKIR